jgi:anti-sigma B factor antagonist
MNIEIAGSDNIIVATPKGNLSAAAASEARLTLRGQITPRQSRLVLDMANVEYLDSSGLAAIVETMKQARAWGGDVKLCALRPDVRSILDMTRLTAVISIHISRHEAIASW